MSDGTNTLCQALYGRDAEPADYLGGADAKMLHDAASRIRDLEDRLFALGAMEQAPCFCCGYNGPRYFQPDTHPCAARHHAAMEGE